MKENLFNQNLIVIQDVENLSDNKLSSKILSSNYRAQHVRDNEYCSLNEGQTSSKLRLPYQKNVIIGHDSAIRGCVAHNIGCGTYSGIPSTEYCVGTYERDSNCNAYIGLGMITQPFGKRCTLDFGNAEVRAPYVGENDVVCGPSYPLYKSQISLNFENPKAHVSSVSDNLIRTSAISDPGQFGTYVTHLLDSDSMHQLPCIPTVENLVSNIATGMSHIIMDDQCKKHNVEKETQLNHYPSVLAANGLSTVPKVASDASEGFDQIIDFLNASSIKYALTVNPNIYVSCIKQFWTSVSVKKINDVTRLQALVDKKKVIITEATIRDALHLDDAESIDCLPNEEIFTELSRMGLVRNVDSSTKVYMYPQFLQLMIRAQVGDLSLYSTKYSSPALTQKVFANMRNVGKGFFRVDTPLFEGIIVAQQADEGATEVNVNDVPAAGVADEGDASVAIDDVLAADAEISMDLLHTLLDTCTTLTRRVEHLEQDKITQTLEITKLKQRVKMLEMRNKLKVSKLRRFKKVGTLQRVDTSEDTVMDDVFKQGRIIANMDADKDITLKDVTDIAKEVIVDAEIEENADVQGRQAESQAQIYQIDLEHVDKVLSMQDDKLEPAELQEVVEVVTTTKLMTKVVIAASATITAADIPITAAAPTLTTAPSATRRRNGVIMVHEPKPLKMKTQIEQDEAYARELEAELSKNIDWDEVIEQVQRKEKEDNVVMRNMAGFKMDYFKGMTYDDIRPIFEKKFNSNIAFLVKTKEQMEEEDSRALRRKVESSEDKAAKKQKLDKEVEELRKHL
uniref:Xylulose kinase-1 n=1 Tax=Tanacetum cinerariifolium TaxID=118510 RepID=A0A6L2JCV9_TANCI|nr:hypothetical protein [Tanacetum cinerariifolium]